MQTQGTTTNGSGKVDWTKIPEAQLDPMLEDFSRQMEGCGIQDEFECAGHMWTLRGLENADEQWADGLTDGTNIYQTGRNRRLPYLAASLVAFDGKPVAELFKLPAETPVETRSLLEADAGAMKAWVRQQVLAWLGQRGKVQPEVIAELYNAYLSLGVRRRRTLEALGPLAIDPLTGLSSSTSSDEPES